MAILKHSSNKAALLAAQLSQMPTAAPAPAPAPSVPEPVEPVVPISGSIDIDALMLTEDQANAYGPDLLAAFDKLVRYTATEGISLADMRDAFKRVNDILLANPSLATEVILPDHIGDLCRAAYKLSQVSTEVGSARKTTRESKAKAAKDAVYKTTNALAALESKLALANRSNSDSGDDEDEADV